MEKSVNGPFHKLSVRLGMTLPLVVESAFALSLALYLSPQDAAFGRGNIVYDRAVSMRTVDSDFGGLRALTGAYLPNFISLDLARASLW